MDIVAWVLNKTYTDERVSELVGLDYSDINAKLDALTQIKDVGAKKMYRHKAEIRNGHVVMIFEEVL